jgi:hypothetical protein
MTTIGTPSSHKMIGIGFAPERKHRASAVEPPVQPSVPLLTLQIHWTAGLLETHLTQERLARVRQKYRPQTYDVRVHRADGTHRLLLGEAGRLPCIGKVVKIPIGRDEALIARIVAHPESPGEPVEAAELARLHGAFAGSKPI